MDKVIETWNGEWWVPQSEIPNAPNAVGRLLYYENKNPELEITVISTANAFVWPNKEYPVIYGMDASGNIFSLFNAYRHPENNASKIVFSIDYILIGEQVSTMEDTLFFKKAIVTFPHLHDLFVFRRVEEIVDNSTTTYKINHQPSVLEYPIKIDDKTTWTFVSNVETNITGKHYSDIHIHQDTNLVIEHEEITSINHFKYLISEFSQFLSVALFSNQQPSKIILVGESWTTEATLLYKPKASAEWHLRFIGDAMPNSRISELLTQWHAKFNDIAPISSYLIRSTEYQTEFDAPDFLIVAQALDGYWKRFFNKCRTEGKDIRKYNEELQQMMAYFRGVAIIQNLGLDTVVAVQTRHKYTHWTPNGEEGTELAVTDPKQLRLLTLRMKILLLCCVLDYMGMTIQEIDTSFKVAGDLYRYLK